MLHPKFTKEGSSLSSLKNLCCFEKIEVKIYKTIMVKTKRLIGEDKMEKDTGKKNYC